MNDRFREAVQFCKYYLDVTLGRYNDQVADNVVKWAEHLRVQMKNKIFHPFDPVLIFDFLYSLR